MKHLDLKRLRNEYPAGCRIELVQMDDPQAPPVGTLGTVTYKGVQYPGAHEPLVSKELFDQV